MGLLSDTVQDNKFTPEDVPKFEAKLFFEGARRRQYRERFGVLLFLATVIATMGVLGDSTATVIGAMIVAPLMTPIMATTAALLTGQGRRAVRSSVLVVAGVAGVILVSWLFGEFYLAVGRVISFDTNSQITGRVSPRGIDLIAALASGAAGAFAMSRDDIADSLAGVAISISLVPPLCVVGIALAGSEWWAATEALLLFITNYLSILLAGGGVLALLGLGQAATVRVTGTTRRNAYIAIGVAVLIVAIPLFATGTRIASQSIDQIQTRTIVEAWINETNYELQDLQINFRSEQISILISGSGEPPVLSELGPQLEAMFQDDTIEMKLDIVPAEEKFYPETGSEDASSN
jgi:uncharacterized hydrophobic protein (TIGR00271 family)